jgi:hypothetical protein
MNRTITSNFAMPTYMAAHVCTAFRYLGGLAYTHVNHRDYMVLVNCVVKFFVGHIGNNLPV